MNEHISYVVLISADVEWLVVRNYFSESIISTSEYGEWFIHQYDIPSVIDQPILFFHGGWGKVSAAASTQYVISNWHPVLIINLGTCGGFEGKIKKGEIILAEKTVIYDIYEKMGDPDEHIRHYTTDLTISWLKSPLPCPVIRTTLISGDRDLITEEIHELDYKYNAIAGDWESGAIAWVSNKNSTQCLILRGVTDLVGSTGGEAYNGKINIYYENTASIMKRLLESLPMWLTMHLESR